MKKALDNAWFRHLPETEQADFKELVKGNYRVLERLRDIIDERLRDIQQKETEDETYGPGYPFLQAQFNGRVKGLMEVRKLLAFLED